MAATVTAHLGNPDPTANPLNITELVTLLNTLFLPVSIGNYSAQLVVGSSTPAVEDQDKIWFRQTGGTKPLGFYVYYGGNWRPVYSGKSNEITMYRGNPVNDFDTTGLGIIGQTWDGWALCNGSNGTVDLSDRFIVAAHMNKSGGVDQYSSGWQTTADSSGTTKTGGVNTITLTAANTYRPASPAVTVHGATADGNAASATFALFGNSPSGAAFDLAAADAGNTSPPAIPTLPPYYCLAYAMFVGY